MDDTQTFERRVATEVIQGMGPSEPVDDAAIFTAITTTPSPKWRLQPMFSATKFLVAGAVVALFGGMMLIGQPFEQQTGVPGAASTEPGSFSPTDSLSQPRAGHTATLLPDGRVLVVGGKASAALGGEVGTITAEIWDPDTETFGPTGSLAEGRREHSALLLPDGRVLVVGGPVDPYGVSAEVWDPSTGTFSPAGSTDMDWMDRAMVLPDGRVLVVGFVDVGVDEAELALEIWDPATSTFGPADQVFGDDDSDILKGRFLEATALADGRVLFISDEDPAEYGYGFAEGYAPSAEVWDPVTGTFSPAGSSGLVPIRSITLLADGRVLVVGGGDCQNPDTPAPHCVVVTEVWDPATSTFSPAGSVPGSDRFLFTATALSDGRALVAGGCSDNDQGCYDNFESAWVWDPGTATFGPTGSLAVARAEHTATPLSDGRVLVVGGFGTPVGDTCGWHDCVVWDSAEIWEPGER